MLAPTPRASRGLDPRRVGFTLIELLVVIAIIALLVGILLPALKNARRSARLTQSMSQVKQIAIAFDTYRTEHKGFVPEHVPRTGPTRVPATWSFVGKDANAWWQTNYTGYYDFPAATRPLNPYLYPDVIYPPLTPATRQSLEMPIARSPGDIGSAQRNFPTLDPSITSYDDVGTSYHYNGRWYDALPTTTAANWANYATRLCAAFGKLVDSSGINVSTFVMMHDQTADRVANDDLARNHMGEFGDKNKSVMAFLDCHVDYMTVIPYAFEGPGYTFRFPLITRLPSWITP